MTYTGDWKPDFTAPDPYAGMPPEYAEEVKRTFVPSAGNPLPPLPAQYLKDYEVPAISQPKYQPPTVTSVKSAPPPGKPTFITSYDERTRSFTTYKMENGLMTPVKKENILVLKLRELSESPIVQAAGFLISLGFAATPLLPDAPKKMANLADAAGKANTRLQSARVAFSSQTKRDLLNPVGAIRGGLLATKSATALTQAEQDSRAADIKFLDAFGRGSFTVKQMGELEKRSGMRGLTEKMVNIGAEKERVLSAWSKVDKISFKDNPSEHLKALEKLNIAQDKLSRALNDADSFLGPRYKPGPTPERAPTQYKPIKLVFDFTSKKAANDFADNHPLGGGGVAGKKVAVATRPTPVKVGIEIPVREPAQPKVEIASPKPGIAKIAPATPKAAPSVFPGIVTKTKTDISKQEGYSPAHREEVYTRPDAGEIQERQNEPVRSTRIGADAQSKSDISQKSGTQPIPRIRQGEAPAQKSAPAAKQGQQPGAQTKTSTGTSTRITTRPPEKAPPRTPPRTPFRPISTSALKNLSDKQRRALIRERGAAAWPQGELSGKTVWHIVLQPYSEAQHTTVLGQQPQGAQIFKGIGQAYKSITQLSGAPPDKPVRLEGGAIDPVLYRGKNGKVEIDFVANRTRKSNGRSRLRPSVRPSGLAPDIVVSRVGGKTRRHIRLN